MFGADYNRDLNPFLGQGVPIITLPVTTGAHNTAVGYITR